MTAGSVGSSASSSRGRGISGMTRKLEISQLCKSFGELEALRKIDLAVERGESSRWWVRAAAVKPPYCASLQALCPLHPAAFCSMPRT